MPAIQSVDQTTDPRHRVMSDAAKDTAAAPADVPAANSKRTAGAADIDTMDKVKRANDSDPLKKLSVEHRRAVLQACGQTLALHAADKIKGALISEYIRGLSLGDLAAMIVKLSAGDNNALVSILLNTLASPELWLHPNGAECFVFAIVESPCSAACLEALLRVTDLRVLNARSPATGDTLLHRATEHMRCQLVCHMLQCGVDVLPNNRGYHALYAPLIETVDDIDYKKMEAIIAVFNRARQVRPGLFDPNAVVGGETFLGLLCRMPYPKLISAWLFSLDCDLMLAPGRMMDESTEKSFAFKGYKNLLANVAALPPDKFTLFISYGMQLRGQTKLVYDAIWSGRIDIIRELIRQKCDYLFSVEYARKIKNVHVLAYLCRCRKHICRNCRHPPGDRTKDLEIAALIVDNLPNFKDIDGHYALVEAIHIKEIDFIKLFIDRGAKTTGCRDVEHPLMLAMLRWDDESHDAIIRLLVEYGARLSWSARLRFNNNRHELVFAAGLISIGPLRVLLEGDNPPDALADALETACKNKKIEFVRLLLEHKAPCSTKTLRAAAESADRDIVALILAQMPRALPDEIIDLVASVAAGPSKATCSHKP